MPTRKISKKSASKTTKRASKPKPFWRVGQNYFVRTVTNYVTGKLQLVDKTELVFTDAAWIADTGRFADMLMNPDVLREVEPYPNGARVLLNRQAICDACEWQHALPRLQK